MIIVVSRECIKCPSLWFWMSRKSLLEMRGGGGQTTKSTYAKEGGVSSVRVRPRGEGESNFSHFGEYVLIE